MNENLTKQNPGDRPPGGPGEALRDPDQHPPIFVSIASYRDVDCVQTMTDLFAKATYPERVHVGVLWQVAPEDGEIFTQVPERWRENIRGEAVDAGKSLGVCWARHRIQERFWQHEPFYFQIDSHCRFDPKWDERLLAMLRQAPSGRAVLSTHPNAFHPPDQLVRNGLPIMKAGRFDDHGTLIPVAKMISLEHRPALPISSPFIGAGFLFAPASIIQDVPYDPFLYFHGEEITFSVRLWSWGYDLFTPNDVLVFHDYGTTRGRRRHWDDHVDWTRINRRAVARVQHVLGVQTSTDPDAIQQLERYGLGEVRSLDEYETFADVDFRKRRIGVRATDAHFPPAPSTRKEALTMRRSFTHIYRQNKWRAPETRSGPGSAPLVTAALRDRLAGLWQELNVRILVDAGCGDVRWLEAITPRVALYLGFDLVEDLIANNRILFGSRKNHFFNVADITQDVFPRGDLLLCRNTLTHLPNALVQAALDVFWASGTRYLLLTTFPGAGNTEIEPGHWRKIDLTAPPFSLPPPLRMVQDGSPANGCYLGLWENLKSR
ncbi:MAG: hypothetical protein HQL63_07015 [Magnetococcales bacterium]|nr:hypothetical protein [Magnetococcales bacterium]MBF0321947.1 hypothetical protein [Magnetococcales bacterium]